MLLRLTMTNLVGIGISVVTWTGVGPAKEDILSSPSAPAQDIKAGQWATRPA